MKIELGRCLLSDRLLESGITKEELARILLYKPERIVDFLENKRIMSLTIAISIASSIGCTVNELYELIPIDPIRKK